MSGTPEPHPDAALDAPLADRRSVQEEGCLATGAGGTAVVAVSNPTTCRPAGISRSEVRYVQSKAK
jgi:hypothetical protein